MRILPPKNPSPSELFRYRYCLQEGKKTKTAGLQTSGLFPHPVFIAKGKCHTSKCSMHCRICRAGRREQICKAATQTSDPTPLSLRCLCRHVTAVPIVRLTAPAYRHKQIGQLQTQACLVSKYCIGWVLFCRALAVGIRERRRSPAVLTALRGSLQEDGIAAASQPQKHRSGEGCTDTQAGAPLPGVPLKLLLHPPGQVGSSGSL